MYDHIIFFDTETSGRPEKWDIPETESSKWPYIIQIAWIVYDREGNLLKEETHYLKTRGIRISPKSKNIHGITEEKLKKEGTGKKGVLRRFFKDVKRYNALLVAHFVEFDVKMLNAEILRLGLPYSLRDVPLYCTMTAAPDMARDPRRSYPALSSLYHNYFGRKPEREHDALYDARTVATCFFEMRKEGRFTPKDVVYPQDLLTQTSSNLKLKTRLMRTLNRLF